MSLTGQTCLPNCVPQTTPVRSAPRRWISRHRAAIEATATMTLAMSAPILAAVATLQTTV